MIDFVTVTFREEIPILACQAQSMDLYVDTDQLNTIYVVVNDQFDVTDVIDKNWWGRHSDKVLILHRDVFNITIAQHHGWRLQQVLKLSTAARSKSQWSVILDSKTLFIDNVRVKDMFDCHGRPYTSLQSRSNYFLDSIKICFELFDQEVNEMPGPGGVPFWINNRSCQDLLLYIENKFKISFSGWFLSQPLVTEFILYTAWVLKNHNGSLESMYNLQNLYLTNENVPADDPYDFEWRFQTMMRPGLKTISVHRDRWKNLDRSEKQRFIDFLNSRDISRGANLLLLHHH